MTDSTWLCLSVIVRPDRGTQAIECQVLFDVRVVLVAASAPVVHRRHWHAQSQTGCPHPPLVRECECCLSGYRLQPQRRPRLPERRETSNRLHTTWTHPSGLLHSRDATQGVDAMSGGRLDGTWWHGAEVRHKGRSISRQDRGRDLWHDSQPASGDECSLHHRHSLQGCHRSRPPWHTQAATAHFRSTRCSTLVRV